MQVVYANPDAELASAFFCSSKTKGKATQFIECILGTKLATRYISPELLELAGTVLACYS